MYHIYKYATSVNNEEFKRAKAAGGLPNNTGNTTNPNAGSPPKPPTVPEESFDDKVKRHWGQFTADPLAYMQANPWKAAGGIAALMTALSGASGNSGNNSNGGFNLLNGLSRGIPTALLAYTILKGVPWFKSKADAVSNGVKDLSTKAGGALDAGTNAANAVKGAAESATSTLSTVNDVVNENREHIKAITSGGAQFVQDASTMLRAIGPGVRDTVNNAAAISQDARDFVQKNKGNAQTFVDNAVDTSQVVRNFVQKNKEKANAIVNNIRDASNTAKKGADWLEYVARNVTPYKFGGSLVSPYRKYSFADQPIETIPRSIRDDKDHNVKHYDTYIQGRPVVYDKTKGHYIYADNGETMQMPSGERRVHMGSGIKKNYLKELRKVFNSPSYFVQSIKGGR